MKKYLTLSASMIVNLYILISLLNIDIIDLKECDTIYRTIFVSGRIVFDCLIALYLFYLTYIYKNLLK